MPNAISQIESWRSLADEYTALFDKARALRKEYDSLGGAAFLGNPTLGDGLVVADIVAVIVTFAAIDTFATPGHLTNLYKATH